MQKLGGKQSTDEAKDAQKPSNGVAGGEATAGNISRNRSPSKMTKYVECWGADKPFANITESTLAKNIGLTVSNEKFSASWLFVYFRERVHVGRG